MKIFFLYLLSVFSKINLAIGITNPPESTPVIYWSGTQTWATFHQEGRECWNNSQMAEVIRNSDPPESKKKKLDEHGCRLDFGLECVSFTDNNGNGKYGCRCMLNLGREPAIVHPADPNSHDDSNKFGSNAQCFIPAGKGYVSQCFSNNVDKEKLPPSENVGFPYAFGDPSGIGPDPPKLVDSNLNMDVIYVPWNSIRGRCAPNSECVTGSNYLDKRCQCVKGATLIRSTGLCKSKDSASQMTTYSTLLLILSLYYTIFHLLNK